MQLKASPGHPIARTGRRVNTPRASSTRVVQIIDYQLSAELQGPAQVNPMTTLSTDPRIAAQILRMVQTSILL